MGETHHGNSKGTDLPPPLVLRFFPGNMALLKGYSLMFFNPSLFLFRNPLLMALFLKRSVAFGGVGPLDSDENTVINGYSG